jgi:capsular polysaccharide transport system permease protein
MVSRINAEVLQEKATLEKLIAMAPDSPQIASLRVRIQSLETQMDQQRAALVGGDQSMAPKLSQFEQLTLERELAVKSLSSALASLENARQEAQQQQLYLARVVEPNLPDQPLYPKRLFSLMFLAGLFGCVYWIVREFARMVLEHNP